jgi:hypothetical protein
MLGSLTKLLYSIITDIPICRNMTLTVNCSIPRYVVRTYDTTLLFSPPPVPTGMNDRRTVLRSTTPLKILPARL